MKRLPKKLSPQEVRILVKLQNGEKLSQPSMIGEECWRLASRISHIRKHGWNVQHVVMPRNFRLYFIDPECPRITEEEEPQLSLPLEEGGRVND